MSASEARVPWRNIAIGSMLLNLGAVGTVATIATVHDSNSLATIALALAIIAFICQLIIFSVQTWQSGEQLRQAERLNSETSGLIAEMRTRLEGTHQMVTSQYQELLHLAVLKADATDLKAGIVSAENPVTRATAAEIIREVLPAVETEHASSSSVDRNEVASLLVWPQLQDTRRAFEMLHPLNDTELNSFMVNVNLDTLSRLVGTEPVSDKASFTDEPLINFGLIAELPSDPGEKPKVRLTERGRVASRILVPSWPPPDSLNAVNGEIWTLRGRIEPDIVARTERIRDFILQMQKRPTK
jgi:hypothetical protein